MFIWCTEVYGGTFNLFSNALQGTVRQKLLFCCHKGDLAAPCNFECNRTFIILYLLNSTKIVAVGDELVHVTLKQAAELCSHLIAINWMSPHVTTVCQFHGSLLLFVKLNGEWEERV